MDTTSETSTTSPSGTQQPAVPITMTVDQLMKCGVSRENAEVYVPLFNPRLGEAGITTKLRLVHLLAQIIGETHFKPQGEDLGRYTAENLVRTWKRFQVEAVPPKTPGGTIVYKHFKPKKGTPLTASQLAYATAFRNDSLTHGQAYYAKKLGDVQYAHLGGYEYRGHGLIQITGEANYQKMADDTHNPEYKTNPDLLNEPLHAVISALWFWKNKNHDLNKYADKDDIWSVSQIVNVGHRSSHKTKPNGLDVRMAALVRCKQAFGLLPAIQPVHHKPAGKRSHPPRHPQNIHTAL